MFKGANHKNYKIRNNKDMKLVKRTKSKKVYTNLKQQELTHNSLSMNKHE